MKKILVLLICAALLCGCNSEKQGVETTTTASAETTAPIADIAEEGEEAIAEIPEEESEEIVEKSDEAATTDENGLLIYDLETAMENVVYFNDEKVKVSFLSPEQQAAFDKAYYVKLLLSVNSEYFWEGIGVAPDDSKMVENTHFMRSGYSYDSVISEFSSVLGEELMKEYENSAFSNADGEFAMNLGARGGDIFFDSITFEPEPTKNDPDVIFKGVASYCDPDSNESLGDKEIIFRMEKTNNGWKFKEFSLWF